jgi:hypothetical protein
MTMPVRSVRVRAGIVEIGFIVTKMAQASLDVAATHERGRAHPHCRCW